MKKLITILIIALMASNAVQAQCRCNPNNFCPFEFTYNGTTTSSRTVTKFSVYCGKPVKLGGCYKCEYKVPCERQLKAVLKNSSGTIIASIFPFNFPFEYTFETAGSYVLEITPYCGDNTCPTASLYFNVACAPAPPPTNTCVCDPENRWDKFTSYIDKSSAVVKCGHQFSIRKDQQFGLEGGYKCKGNCNTKFVGRLVNTATGEAIEYPSFEFNWLHKFPIAGNYKLVITPFCNGKECTPCIFYFTVD